MQELERKAYVEILEVLKYVSKAEVQRIPKEEIEFFEQNKHATYQFKFDESKNIIEQDLLPETMGLFSYLYTTYVKNKV